MAVRVVDERTRMLVQPSSVAVMGAHVEPTADMAAERRRATFDVQELSIALNGGKEQLEKL